MTAAAVEAVHAPAVIPAVSATSAASSASASTVQLSTASAAPSAEGGAVISGPDAPPTKESPAEGEASPAPLSHAASSLRADAGRSIIASNVIAGAPKRSCAARMHICANTSSMYAGGSDCASRSYVIAPRSTPIASAHSTDVHRHGDVPCTAKILPAQHGPRSGRPNTSSRRHRRRAPRQHRARSSSAGRRNSSSTCISKLVSMSLARSTRKPKSAP